MPIPTPPEPPLPHDPHLAIGVLLARLRKILEGDLK